MDYIARGWAFGVFVGSVIPFGMQLVVAVPLAFRLKISKIGATLGTFVTNPLTILFIYPAQCWVGSRIVGKPLTWEYLRTDVLEMLRHTDVFSAAGRDVLCSLGSRLLAGFFAGGLLLGIVLAPVAYVCVKKIVERHRAALLKRGTPDPSPTCRR